MFIPFLPIILAFLTLGILAQVPISSHFPESFSPWEMVLLLIALSLLIGQVPSRYLGARSMLKFSPRRILFLMLWGGMIYWNRTDQNLPLFFEKFAFNTEFSFFILLLTYWLGDALCLDRTSFWSKSILSEKCRLVLSHLRLQLPILLLMSIQFGIFQVLEYFLLENPEWQKHLLIFLLSLVIMVALGPFIMVSCWGAEPLHSKNAEWIIQEELNANRVPVARIFSWPEHIISTATAGVIGFIPGFRYLLISEQLIQTLTVDELRAVIAHEAGHLRRYHLFFFILSFIAFNGALVFSWHIIYGFQWLFIWEVSIWPYILFAILGFIIFFRIILGYLSRNFERQADCNSLERIGYTPFKQALLKVAWLNGINTEEDNWHHYGVQQRLRFITDCTVHPNRIEFHHQRVSKIKLACVSLALLFFSINVFATSEAVQLQFFQYLLPQQMQSLEQLHQENPLLLKQMTNLATRFQLNNNIAQAEPIYRKILEVSPENPLVLNNLAWLLATHYESSPEKIEESIEFAQLAVAQEDTAFIWDTLAEGYFKLGNQQQAFEAAQHALTLAKQGIGISSEAGLDYYQERSDYFYQLSLPTQ